MRTLADSLLVFIAVYPIVSAAVWIAGGVLFALLRERGPQPELQPGEGPPVSVLIPAYNQAVDIGNAVRAALRLDYHDLEVLVLDDGSTDDTAERARKAGSVIHVSACSATRSTRERRSGSIRARARHGGNT